MSLSCVSRAVRLEFSGESVAHQNLSGAAFCGDWLWVAGDESAGIDRLRRQPPLGDERLRFVVDRSYPLAGLLDLPGKADDEADLEGMALVDGALWVVGSHALKRKNVKPGRSVADNAARLASLSLDANRRVLIRLPIEQGGDLGPQLLSRSTYGQRALRLKGDAVSNLLTRALQHDPHLAPFLGIPGKDNGFDIEGLAVRGDRLWLGLRGPVLRGWSVVLEIRVSEGQRFLHLAPFAEDSPVLLRKHFLPLDGLGVRDLHWQGNDLWVLAGPTLALDGDVRLFAVREAAHRWMTDPAPITFSDQVETLACLPHAPGLQRAEALCRLPDRLASSTLGVGSAAWLVLYDAPAPSHRDGSHAVFGDLLTSQNT